MVWFQCEDCGENLKKPKLLNHFRCCSAYKLSCIDCGVTFSHLCNTSATSQQTLLLHADGKKHRAKARAFHASQQPPKAAEESTPIVNDSTVTKQGAPSDSVEVSKKKRKIDSSDNDAVDESVITTEVVVKDKKRKVTKENGSAKKSGTADTNEAGSKKIKWKKLIKSVLKEQEKTNFSLDKRKLQKAVINTLIKTKCMPADIDAKRRKELKDTVMQQVESSSQFTVDLNRLVKLTKKE